jgi:hypothetical protein
MSADSRRQRACGVAMHVIAVTGSQQFNDHASHGSGRAAECAGRGTAHDLCRAPTTSSSVSAGVDPSRRLSAAPAVVLLAGFTLRQLQGRRPLLPARMLRSRPVVGANLVLAPAGRLDARFQYTVTASPTSCPAWCCSRSEAARRSPPSGPPRCRRPTRGGRGIVRAAQHLSAGWRGHRARCPLEHCRSGHEPPIHARTGQRPGTGHEPVAVPADATTTLKGERRPNRRWARRCGRAAIQPRHCGAAAGDDTAQPTGHLPSGCGRPVSRSGSSATGETGRRDAVRPGCVLRGPPD